MTGEPSPDSDAGAAHNPGPSFGAPAAPSPPGPAIWLIPLLSNIAAAWAGFLGGTDFGGFLVMVMIVLFGGMLGFAFFWIGFVAFIGGRGREAMAFLSSSLLPPAVMIIMFVSADTLRFLWAVPACMGAQNAGRTYEAVLYTGGVFFDHGWEYRVVLVPPDADPSHPPLTPAAESMGYNYAVLRQRQGRCWLMLDSRFEGDGWP